MSKETSLGGMNDDTGFPVFFTEISDCLGRYENYKDAARAIAEKFPPSKFPRLLDICCGIGKMSVSLFELGYEVVGLDLSLEQLSVAKKMCKGPVYIHADMGNLPKDKFDILINVYTSFGYCSTEHEDLAVLPEWYEALNPGGILIMELADMDRARNRIDVSGRLIRMNSGVTEMLFMDWEKRILTVNYDKDGQSWTCSTRLYEKEFLQNALLNCGFSSVELYGDFSQKPKGKDDNLLIIARKGL